MKIVQKVVLSIEEKVALMQLWNAEYPVKLNLKTIEDFELYLNGLSETKHYLLLNDSGLGFYFFKRRGKLVCYNFKQ